MLVGVTKSILVSRAAGDLWLFFFFFAVHGRNLSKDAFLRGLFIYSGDTFMRPITHPVADAVFWPPFRRGQMKIIMNAFLWIYSDYVCISVDDAVIAIRSPEIESDKDYSIRTTRRMTTVIQEQG